MVMSWIVNCIAPLLNQSFLLMETSHQLWEDLKVRFDQANGPKIFKLIKVLSP